MDFEENIESEKSVSSELKGLKNKIELIEANQMSQQQCIQLILSKFDSVLLSQQEILKNMQPNNK